jgi:diphosphomevalonate decarboxylase
MFDVKTVTARANSNIAFIKYWGNRDEDLRLPANPSLSMNIDGIHTQTTVRWDKALSSDILILNGERFTDDALKRVTAHLDLIRQRADITTYAHIDSVNNFPMGAGIASSASSFAALTVAAVEAAGLVLSERELTTLARQGSGSASRSVPAGFVEWHAGATNAESFAESIAGVEHWGLVDVVAVISSGHKAVGSKRGHTTANTSDLQAARLAGASERLRLCKQALLERDFPTFAEVVEHDSNLMHAVMMTSRPPLFYWLPTTLTIMEQVRRWRADGLSVCYTLDAGPNVHCLCLAADAPQVKAELEAIEDVQTVLSGGPGDGAVIV